MLGAVEVFIDTRDAPIALDCLVMSGLLLIDAGQSAQSGRNRHMVGTIELLGVFDDLASKQLGLFILFMRLEQTHLWELRQSWPGFCLFVFLVGLFLQTMNVRLGLL